jgi:hypothetical protein
MSLDIKGKDCVYFCVKKITAFTFALAGFELVTLELRGCQIFLGDTYQNWKISAEWPQNISNGHKVYKMAIQNTRIMESKAFQIIQTWALLHENIQCDNPDQLKPQKPETIPLDHSARASTLHACRHSFALSWPSNSVTHVCQRICETWALAFNWSYFQTGWPNWENFRILGDCLLWAVIWKFQK